MNWTFKKEPSVDSENQLKKLLNIDDLIAKLLILRGIETYDEARVFFKPSLDDLHDPFLMKDMELAVARIVHAINEKEKIMVYGDYDVDGTTAVSLVYSFLQKFYPNITTYIPDRYAEGYGISFQSIDFAFDNDIKLIIALDCGIKSVDKIDYAKQKGIDFIICDHHQPGLELPDAVAILNPKQTDCYYPFDELCGCGIGFKLVQAIGQHWNISLEELKPYLDLVAIAIGADIVPLNGENRTLTYLGLDVINTNPRPGVQALIKQAKRESLTNSDVVFGLAPRINAAGRMKHGQNAVQLLIEEDIEIAMKFAEEIELYNSDRREVEAQNSQEAILMIEELKEENNFSTVIYNENWHKGVIGIVASRLQETYYRPTIVFTKSGDYLAASARSVNHFDIYEAIEKCSEHLIQYGGHKYAAGMTIKPENFNAFKAAFETVVKSTIKPEWLEREISIDAKINFTDITPKFVRLIKKFEPFGPCNPTPIFYSNKIFDTGYAKSIGKNNEHLKMFLKQSKSEEGLAAVAFGIGQKLSVIEKSKPFEACYSIDENLFNGQVTLQLRIRDLRVEG
jgi:single-stranded-DNA-specific exonuclease